MNKKFRLRFLETNFFANPETGMPHILVPVAVQEDAGLRLAHFVEPKQIPEYIDVQFFETEIGANEKHYLSSKLKEDDQGIEWWGKFESYFTRDNRERTPLELSIEIIPAKVTCLKYVRVLPYSEELKLGHRFQETYITSIPNKAFYGRFLVNIIKQKGEIQHRSLMPKVCRNDRTIESYLLYDPPDKSKPSFRNGILLGTLEEADFKKPVFESCFPLNHFLSIDFPVALPDIKACKPLAIEIYI